MNSERGDTMRRSAVEPIKGYFYQFDYSISRIFDLENLDDQIEIEHVEDLDIKTATEQTAIQCKYYEKTEYNHSVIAKPLRYMLTHYMSTKNNPKEKYNYKLYGYYAKGQEKLKLPMSTDYLIRKFLAYKQDNQERRHHEEVGATKKDIEEFLNVLDIDINAKGYGEQIQAIINSIMEQFSCTEFEAEHYYYNNALKVIKDLAVNSDVGKRTIKKKNSLN